MLETRTGNAKSCEPHDIPVHVVVNSDAALIGAALFAKDAMRIDYQRAA